MKKSFVLFPVLLFFLLTFGMSSAQQANEHQNNLQISKEKVEEEEGPILLKFEPDFAAVNERRTAEILHTRTILDTMDISDRKRRRLLKDLYKNGVSEKLSNTLLSTSKFEDVDQ